MIENGILKDHPVDVALAYHVSAGKMPIVLYMYNNSSTMMFSVDGFKINIQVKGSNGGYIAHNPKVKFNEDVCPIGASCMAHCATEWLKNNK